MRQALRVFVEALIDTFDELFRLVPMSALTVLLLLPVVTGPPALAGLWAVGNRAARKEATGWGHYFQAFRAHFGRAWAIAGLNLLALVVVGGNVWFYGLPDSPLGLSGELSMYIRVLWIGLLVPWLLLSQYVFPLLLEQKDQRVRIALRNAAALLATQPAFSVTLFALTILVAAVSTLLTVPWFLITPGFLAVLTNDAVLQLLKPHRQRMEAGEEE